MSAYLLKWSGTDKTEIIIASDANDLAYKVDVFGDADGVIVKELKEMTLEVRFNKKGQLKKLYEYDEVVGEIENAYHDPKGWMKFKFEKRHVIIGIFSGFSFLPVTKKEFDDWQK